MPLSYPRKSPLSRHEAALVSAITLPPNWFFLLSYYRKSIIVSRSHQGCFSYFFPICRNNIDSIRIFPTIPPFRRDDNFLRIFVQPRAPPRKSAVSDNIVFAKRHQLKMIRVFGARCFLIEKGNGRWNFFMESSIEP